MVVVRSRVDGLVGGAALTRSGEPPAQPAAPSSGQAGQREPPGRCPDRPRHRHRLFRIEVLRAPRATTEHDVLAALQDAIEDHLGEVAVVQHVAPVTKLLVRREHDGLVARYRWSTTPKSLSLRCPRGGGSRTRRRGACRVVPCALVGFDASRHPSRAGPALAGSKLAYCSRDAARVEVRSIWRCEVAPNCLKPHGIRGASGESSLTNAGGSCQTRKDRLCTKHLKRSRPCPRLVLVPPRCWLDRFS